MKKILSILLLVVAMAQFGFSQSKPYTDITQLYSDFAVIIKSNKWSEIENYCKRINFEKDPNFDYKSPTFDSTWVKKFYKSQHNYAFAVARSSTFMPLYEKYVNTVYLKSIMDIKQTLAERGLSKNVKLEKIESNGNLDLGEGVFTNKALLKFTSGSTSFSIQLGVFIKVKNKWKIESGIARMELNP